jgi:MFS family permease
MRGPEASGGDAVRRGLTVFFGVLSVVNFRRYFIGQSISELGNALIPVTLAFAVLDQTHSVTDLSIVLASQSVAQLAFFLLGGVIADLVPRRDLMLWSDITQMVVIGVLGGLLVAGSPPVALIAAAVAVQGIAEAMFLPATSGLVPALVKPEQLQQANALRKVASAASGIVGPAIAGVLVATVGPGWAIIGDAISFAASVVSLARLELEHVRRPQRSRPITELRTGWNAFRERTWVWAITVSASVFNFAYGIYVVLGPTTSIRYYHGATTWATISAAAAAGSVAGGLVSTRLRPNHPMRWGLPAASCFALAPLALAGPQPIVIVAVMAAIGGAGLIVFSSFYDTAIQQSIPEELLSRVSSYDWLGSSVAFPLGLLAAGPLIENLGIRPSLIAICLVTLVSVSGLLAVPSVRNLSAAKESAGCE